MAGPEDKGKGERDKGTGLLLKRILTPIVTKRLDTETARITPSGYAAFIRDTLTDDERRAIEVIQPAFLLACLAERVKAQTRPRTYRSRAMLSGELFPDAFLNDWIAAAAVVPEEGDEDLLEEEDKQQRIKVRCANWDDSQAYRENQIRSMRAANLAFEIWERRRDALAMAGMAADRNMTIETAVAIIKAKPA
jgi:hypothetical protein